MTSECTANGENHLKEISARSISIVCCASDDGEARKHVTFECQLFEMFRFFGQFEVFKFIFRLNFLIYDESLVVM